MCIRLCTATYKARISADSVGRYISYDKSISAYRLSVKFHRYANPASSPCSVLHCGYPETTLNPHSTSMRVVLLPFSCKLISISLILPQNKHYCLYIILINYQLVGPVASIYHLWNMFTIKWLIS